MKKVSCTFILILFFFQLNAQIVFNGSSTGSGTGVVSLSYSKNVAAGNNRLLYVGVTTQNKNITSVTWNGLALTQFTIGTRNSMRVAMYFIALGSSATPTTANVVVTLAGGTDVFSGAADYSGVWQATPLQSPTVAQAKSLYPSVTFTSQVGHKAISLMGDIAATPIANGVGQSQYWSFTGSHSNRSTEEPGASSVTMSHTLSANEDWVMIGATMLDYELMLLPVEILNFKAENKNKKVHVKWNTASEFNSDFFTVQRSSDALNFEDLGILDASGNSFSEKHYFFKDEAPLDGISYYRLRETSLSGKIFYSDLAAVSISEVSILNFFPNPTFSNSQIIISSPEKMDVSFVITNADGKRIRETKTELPEGISTFMIDVTTMSEGNYFFSIQDEFKVYAKTSFLAK